MTARSPLLIVAAVTTAAAGCGGDDQGLESSASTAAQTQGVSAAYRFAEPPVVVWTWLGSGDRRTATFKAYVRLNRALPPGRENLYVGDAAPQPTFIVSRRRHCYLQIANGGELTPPAERPADGEPVVVEVRFKDVRLTRTVPARKVTKSAWGNDRKERRRLRRLGCGRDART